MTDYLNPEGGPVDGARRRALWTLVALACVAVLIGALMLLLGSGSGHNKNNDALDVPTSTPTSSGESLSSHAASTPPATPTTRTVTTATSPTPTTSAPRTGNPCSGKSNCGVAGDGGVVAALNAYRTAHGNKAVTGTASAAALTCAEHNGSAQFCAEHWIYTTLGSQSGPECVKKLIGFNANWLLDKKITSISVGWAYTGGSYQCVVTKKLSTD